MEAIKGLITNIPDWVKRLDELNGQIDQRQHDLARLLEHDTAAAEEASLARTKSIRNKGSTESLKPHDDAPAFHEEQQHVSPTTPAEQPPHDHHEATQVKEAAQAKARANMRRRSKRRDSLASAEGAPHKYRSRTMIIVYYDSYVQSFFEELVKFVSASRNMMRKAKMAAKVAQIKRMAELEIASVAADRTEETAPTPAPAPRTTTVVPAVAAAAEALKGGAIAVDSSEQAKPADAGANKLEAEDSKTPLPELDLSKLNYRSTRNLRPSALRVANLRTMNRPSYSSRSGRGHMSGDQPPDVYDELDKGLEYVQAMCEHAAHQFLRDGDCNEEIENMKRRLGETKEVADREMERIKKEDPEVLNQPEEPMRSRSFRPQTMRKDTSSSSSADGKEAKEKEKEKETKEGKEGQDQPAQDTMHMELEVDEGVQDMEVDEPPKLMYRSTRMMR